MNSKADGYGTFRYTVSRIPNGADTMNKPTNRHPTFGEARALEAPLADQLAQFAASVSNHTPELAVAYEALIEKLTRAGTSSGAPKVGERLPSFLLPDTKGRFVSLEDLLADGPLVISFNRGNWCRHCWLEAALGDIAEDVKAQGANIVSITPETAAYNCEIIERLNLSFSFLTDLDNSYSLELGIAMPLSAEVKELFKPRGLDLAVYQKNDAWFVPLPANFIVDRDAVIRHAYVNTDYRQRFDPTSIPTLLADLD